MTVEWAMESYAKVDCCVCAMIFYVPAALDQRRREDHEEFYCPSGHSQHYAGKTSAEKYKELYEKERACCVVKSKKLRAVNDEAEQLTRAVNGYKGKIAQMTNRAASKGEAT